MKQISNCNLPYSKFENLLKERKVTSYQVSKETGITSATLSEWKSAKYTPKVDKLLKIAQYFGVPLEYFLEEGDEMKNNVNMTIKVTKPFQLEDESAFIGDNTINNKLNTIKSIDLVEIINQFRKLESETSGIKYVELQHKNFMEKIRKEVETLKTLGLEGQLNFQPSSYINSQNKEQPCFKLTRDGMLQMLNSESVLVRYKTIEYMNFLENKIKNFNNRDLLIQFLSQLPQDQIKQIISQLQVKLLPGKPVIQALYDFLSDNRECLSLTCEDFVEVNFKIFSSYFESNGYVVSDVLKELRSKNLVQVDAFGFCVKGNSKIVIKMKPSLKFYECDD